MNNSRLFRSVWFRTVEERCWFASQTAAYYSCYRQSVVLYALRRLSLIFNKPLMSFSGMVKLLDFTCEARTSFLGRIASVFRLVPCPTNPLQKILDDYTCVEEVFPDDRMMPIAEDCSVRDYVRFVVECDNAARRVDHRRVTSVLGIAPP